MAKRHIDQMRGYDYQTVDSLPSSWCVAYKYTVPSIADRAYEAVCEVVDRKRIRGITVHRWRRQGDPVVILSSLDLPTQRERALLQLTCMQTGVQPVYLNFWDLVEVLEPEAKSREDL
ncbi:MAG TPA: hypothetical protein VLE47_02300 [Candidatus Saccharimonadales bacterium]|nr:hypothetical protein [Candidatus Saccharimonadales bacterium]